MSKSEKFKRIVAANQRTLAARFGAPRVSNWKVGRAIPTFEAAAEIAAMLGIRLDDLPYHRIERRT